MLSVDRNTGLSAGLTYSTRRRSIEQTEEESKGGCGRTWFRILNCLPWMKAEKSLVAGSLRTTTVKSRCAPLPDLPRADHAV